MSSCNNLGSNKPPAVSNRRQAMSGRTGRPKADRCIRPLGWTVGTVFRRSSAPHRDASCRHQDLYTSCFAHYTRRRLPWTPSVVAEHIAGRIRLTASCIVALLYREQGRYYFVKTIF